MKNSIKTFAIVLISLLYFGIASAQDSLKLRTTVNKVLGEKDSSRYDQVGLAYLKGVKKPFLRENTGLVMPLVLSEKDKLFNFLIKNDHLLMANQGVDFLESLKWRIVEQDISLFNISNKSESEWDGFIQKMGNKYGPAGTEISNRYFLLKLIEKKDSSTFSRRVDKYLSKSYLVIHQNDVNELCWGIFQLSQDELLINNAITWMTKIVSKETAPYQYLDTYANLLYKAGKITDAIEWQKKVVEKSNHAKDAEDVLSAMKEGRKTW